MPNKKNTGTAWSDDEIEIIVEDYLLMLQSEQAGEAFNKAERNRALQSRIDRSKGSIEYKHQNVSAVMEVLGLPFIRGYKPAKNFQRRLLEVTESKLIENNLADRLSCQVREPSAPYPSLTMERPPAHNPLPSTSDPAIRRIVRKFDPAARDARARELGEAGEKYLFDAERNRLRAAGKDRLAKKVRWVSKEDGDGAGYDIRSFSERGDERWLEVKTTNGSRRTPFWISANELQVSKERPDVFRLVRIYDFSRAPAAYKLVPPLTDYVHLAATEYRATLLSGSGTLYQT